MTSEDTGRNIHHVEKSAVDECPKTTDIARVRQVLVVPFSNIWQFCGRRTDQTNAADEC